MSALAVVVSDEGLGGVVPFGVALAQRGLTPILVAGPATPRSRLAAWQQTFREIHEERDPYRPMVLLDAVRRAAAGRPIAACFSCYDGLSFPAAQTAAALGVPHPALAGLATSRHKGATRRATCKAGLPTPRWTYINTPSDATRAGAVVGFPAILKPVNGMASHLVRRIEDERELHVAVEEVLARLETSFAGNYRAGKATVTSATTEPEDGRLLLEECLAGAEYSAEVIVSGGCVRRVALFHKWVVDPRGFLERAFTRPPLCDRSDEKALWQHVENCLHAAGVDRTAAHVELMATPDGPRLLEINAGRAGGQILVLATKEATGIDLIEEIVSLAIGDAPPTPGVPRLTGRVSTFSIFPPHSGCLDRIEGMERVARMPGVERVVPFVTPGECIDADDKEVFAVNVLVQGGDHASLVQLHDEINRTLILHVAPLSRGADRRPVSEDGQRRFKPTTTLAVLAEEGSLANQLIRIAGRSVRSQTGSYILRDGDQTVAIDLAGEACDPAVAIPDGAWLGVQGRWDPAAAVLRDAVTVFRRDPAQPFACAIESSQPEARFLADPALLRPIATRSRLLALLRDELTQRRFLEVQTPFLHGAAENANVRQYATVNRAGRLLYLRTDPEEYLKRLLTAGLEAVFEMSCNVRGEPADQERLEEFTSVEAYRRFDTLPDMINLTEVLISRALETLRGNLETTVCGRPVSFAAPPCTRTVREAIADATDIDLDACPSTDLLSVEVRTRKLAPAHAIPEIRSAWIEWLLEAHVLPRIERPTYLVEFPRELGISACPLLDRPHVCHRAELYLPGGLELAHLYENVTEPTPLTRRLEERRLRRVAHGYDEVEIDEGLIMSTAMGMPPMAGLAIGVDRLLMLVLGTSDVGAGLMFPREGQSSTTGGVS